MAKIKINGDSSGYVEIAAPNAAHNNTLELGPGTKILTDKNTHTGNIGIGTDNPGTKLDVRGGNWSNGDIVVGQSGNAGRVKFRRGVDGSDSAFIGFAAADNNNRLSIGVDSGDGTIAFQTNSAERFRITSAGKVGINETAPAADLVVKQSGNTFTTQSQTVALFQRSSTAGHGAKIAIVAGTGGSSDINFGDTADEDIGIIQYFHTDNSLRFTTNTSERLRIKSDGKAYFTSNLGLGGQTSPASSIHINNFGNDGYELKLTGNALQFNRTSNSYIDQLNDSGSILFRMTSSNTEAMRITSDRVVKIPDGGKLSCGTGDDLEIEHNGSTSFIRTSATSTGDLAIESRGTNHDLYLTAADDIYIRPQGGEDGIKVYGNGSVELFYDSAKKLETKSNGTQTTGRIFLNGTNGGFDYNNTAHTLEFLVSNGTTHSELTHNAYVPSASNTRHLGYANKRWATLYVDKIAFGGSSNTDQHSLDDYEEGTYTPTYQNFTTTGTSTLVGKYVKVGRQVTVGIKWSCTGTIAHSTSAFVSLPFAMTYGEEYNGLIGMLHNNNGTSQTSGKSGVQCKLDGEGGSRFFPGSFTTTSSGETLLFGGTYIAAS